MNVSLGYRVESQVDGVDCASCQMRGGIHHGPRTVTDTPHGTVWTNPLFQESSFCASCHQFDDSRAASNGKPLENTCVEWAESRYAEKGQTCQSCHMSQGKHEFAGIHDRRMTRRGLAASARRRQRALPSKRVTRVPVMPCQPMRCRASYSRLSPTRKPRLVKPCILTSGSLNGPRTLNLLN